MGKDYALELCRRADLPGGAFILLHDDHPEGEEEVPEEDSPEPCASREQVA